jgi:hypothetical protein
MKTSKIIFSSLLGAIALLILAAFIDIKINGHKKNTYPSDLFKVNKTNIPPFKVLYLNNCVDIELIRNDSSSIEMIFQKDSLLSRLNYTIAGDTLFVIDNRQSNRKTISCKIHATGKLASIILENSDISMSNLCSGSLSLKLNGGKININTDKKGNPSLSSIVVDARNHSSLYTGEFRVDSLSLVLRNSEVNIELNAKKIHGTLADSSKIYARQPGEIYLKKDSTSTISFNEY